MTHIVRRIKGIESKMLMRMAKEKRRRRDIIQTKAKWQVFLILQIITTTKNR